MSYFGTCHTAQIWYFMCHNVTHVLLNKMGWTLVIVWHASYCKNHVSYSGKWHTVQNGCHTCQTLSVSSLKQFSTRVIEWHLSDLVSTRVSLYNIDYTCVVFWHVPYCTKCIIHMSYFDTSHTVRLHTCLGWNVFSCTNFDCRRGIITYNFDCKGFQIHVSYFWHLS